jgi:hypothetical protein
MKNTLWFLLMVTVAAVLECRAEIWRTNINPALTYYNAFLMQPKLPAADSDYLSTNTWQSQRLPKRVGELLAQYDDQFRLVRQAAHSSAPCDWGFDFARGPGGGFVTFMARGKGVAQMGTLRVQWYLQNGRQQDACDELLASFVLGRHISSDGLLTSMLVRFAIETMQTATIAENFGRFSPDSLRRLSEGLDALPRPLTSAEGLATEKAVFVDWMPRKILELRQQHPGDEAKVLKEFHESFVAKGEESLSWPSMMQAAGGTSEGILKLVREYAAIHVEMTKFFRLPYQEYASREEAYKKTLHASTNPIVSNAAVLLKMREREFRAIAMLAMLRAGIEYKLHGKEALNRVLDPCGTGPFAFRRFVFDGVNRGFELKSAYAAEGYPVVLIFVETEGPPFHVSGMHPGTPLR